MAKEELQQAEYVVLGQVFEALIYDTESVSRAAAINKLKLLLNDAHESPRKTAILTALNMLS